MARRFSLSVNARRGDLGIPVGIKQFGGSRDRPGTTFVRLSRDSADLCVAGGDWGVGLRCVQQPNRSLFCNAGYLFVALVISMPSDAIGSIGATLLNYLDFSEHFYQTLFRGVFDLRDIVYYLSVTALALVMGTMAVETRRWR